MTDKTPPKVPCHMCGGKRDLFTKKYHSVYMCVHCDFPCGLGELVCRKCLSGRVFNGIGPMRGRP